MALPEEALKLLIASQNSDGGWGAVVGKGSNTEVTALAILALRSGGGDRGGERGRRWLIEHQNSDGSWPLSATAKGSSWSTALAMIALGDAPEPQERIVKAGNWVLEQEGSKPGILANIIRAIRFEKNVVHLNEDLIGWSWSPNTFSWVEPTSYCLLALKKNRRVLPEKAWRERVEQGELMIYDRMCEGGGWNYGNSSVYGDSMWPYPDVTAVALIALQDRRERKENQKSLRVLVDLAQKTDSGLALAWTAICLALYGEDNGEIKKLLAQRFAKTHFLGETKLLALAVLATGNGASFFRV